MRGFILILAIVLSSITYSSSVLANSSNNSGSDYEQSLDSSETVSCFRNEDISFSKVDLLGKACLINGKNCWSESDCCSGNCREGFCRVANHGGGGGGGPVCCEKNPASGFCIRWCR